jgi:hypothetical protein
LFALFKIVYNLTGERQMKRTAETLFIPTLLAAAIGLSACSSSSSSTSSNGTPGNGDSSSNQDSSTGDTTNQTIPTYQSDLFSVRGTWAIMDGEITSNIVAELNTLVKANPQVKAIVMQNVPGSSDDEANLQAGLRIRELGLNTYLPPGGEIASGGVDLFLAGAERFAAPDVLVGVHSWGGDDVTDASTLPRGDSSHDLYLNYYQQLGIDSDFYWFTIQAADAENIHWMSDAERKQYGITTRAATDDEINMITDHGMSDAEINSMFDQYAWVEASNGLPIHIFAAEGVSNLQIAKARAVMSHYLSNGDGLVNKDKMSARLGTDQASLFMFANESDSEAAFEGSLGELVIAEQGQDLYATEVFVEGDNNYVNRATVDTRDATYEEVLHLVQGHGLAPTETTLQNRIVTLADQALMDKVWNPEAGDVTEWAAETGQNGYNSLNYEYLAAAVEGYYGVWGHSDVGLDGYVGVDRSSQQQYDPNGFALIEEVWSQRIQTAMPVSADFAEGATFSLQFNEAEDYTHQSQFLLHVYLTGSNNSHILGNDGNNILQGNAGNNQIDGADGHEDVVLFKGLRREYQLEQQGDDWRVKDSVENRDGDDQLVNVEFIGFMDELVDLNQVP